MNIKNLKKESRTLSYKFNKITKIVKDIKLEILTYFQKKREWEILIELKRRALFPLGEWLSFIDEDSFLYSTQSDFDKFCEKLKLKYKKELEFVEKSSFSSKYKDPHRDILFYHD